MECFVPTRLLIASLVLCAGLAHAQAPPGPLTPPPSSRPAAEAPPAPKKPEIAPRKTIMGAWKFNKDESDDGRERLKQSRQGDNTNRGSGGGMGGPTMGGGWPGMGGPMGRGGYGYPQQHGEDISDSLGDIVNPPREMRFSQKSDNDPEVFLNDDREHRTSFYTDGRKLEKSKESSYQEIAAHWDSAKLVTDEKASHGGHMVRTFGVSPDGKQLFEDVHITDSKGNHPINIQYVYDAIETMSR